ncbi:MAG: GHKL domain-containing protein [Anaerorhabdus sp.]|uniref:GHKL domain-containing protein n=1 Tax=Anaerorhabdus sp. TaxID=1872524 RepID=UPI003A89D089
MNIWPILVNFLQSTIIVFFIEKTITKKRNYSIVYPVFLTLFMTLLITIMNNFFIHEGILGFLFLIVPFIYTILHSCDSLVKIAIISFLPYTLIGYISTITVVIFSLFFNYNVTFTTSMINMNVLLPFLITLLFFISIYFSINFIKKIDLDIKKSDSIYMIFLLMAIVFIQIFFENLIFTDQINKLSLFIAYFSLIFALYLLFVIIVKMNQNFKELKKKELDIVLLNNKIEHNEEVMNFQQEIYKLRHDMKHLLLLKESDNKELIKDLATTYLDKINQLPFSYNTSNKVLNYVLKIKKEEAFLHNIDFTVTTNIVDPILIEDIDLYLLLMNLLDNAIENIGGNREIKVTISTTSNSLIIKSINSTSPTLPSMIQDIPSKKKEDGHGLGLKTMRNIAEKYNGSIVIAQKHDEFVVDIEFKNSFQN